MCGMGRMHLWGKRSDSIERKERLSPKKKGHGKKILLGRRIYEGRREQSIQHQKREGEEAISS